VCVTELGFSCNGQPSTCTKIAIAEIEATNTQANADASVIQFTSEGFVAGSIGANTDVDVFKLTLATPQVIRFETFTTDRDCNATATTTLRVKNSAFTDVYVDLDSGIGGCSAIVAPLGAGTYYVSVEETGLNATIPAYLLQLKVQGDGGTEQEPNEAIATASGGLVNDNIFVLGGHLANADSDVYMFNVLAGSSIRAEVIEGSAAETCESNGINSRLTLLNSAGTTVVDDDDDGRGLCSQIDGTGTLRKDAAAGNLAAGTYYLQVRASTLAQAGAAGQFDYRVQLTIRQP
jgi:hypothetical protein